MAGLPSVNVGLPRDVAWQGKTVHAAVWKAPVEGPRMVRRLNIDGDGQADLAGHGGEHWAVFVYQVDSYRYWQDRLRRNDFAYGQFDENFTVEGLSDAEVCIGDQYRIGGALLEVTQPRVGRRTGGRRRDRAGRVRGRADDVFEINALLYMSGHPRDQLERALRIPALSTGWRRSFEALLTQERKGGLTTGNAGLTAASGPPPAWRRFRPLRVSRKVRDSANVISLRLEPTDGHPIAPALPGQFVVLRFGPASMPALMRSYSLSGEPDAASYRVSIKREVHGAASAYVDDGLQVGDIVQASGARGTFTLRQGDTPVVLLSAGIGVTPVLAMLHALAAEATTREVWWLYGARRRREHPFAEETRRLLEALARRHSYICYSSPELEDRLNADFRRSWSPGPASASGAQPAAQCRFLCLRTVGLHERSHCRPHRLGRRARSHPHRDIRRRSFHHARHCRLAAPAATFAGRRSRLGTDGFVRPQRSQCAVGTDMLQLARIGRSLRRAGAMGVSNGGLPQLRNRTCGEQDRLSAGPGRRTGGWQCADLLRATQERCRD
jgi:ferredoxin-NADP reductase/MOSC domain-containing protein YiiM